MREINGSQVNTDCPQSQGATREWEMIEGCNNSHDDGKRINIPFEDKSIEFVELKE